MKLERLIKKYHLVTNTNYLKKNDIFVATLGNYDKNRFVYEAINKKCSLVVSNVSFNNKKNMKCSNPSLFLYELLDYKYHYPLLNKNLIGITGTDGKTTCVTILRYMLNGASIGTNGVEYFDKKLDILNTTPDLVNLFKFFELINKKKISDIIMEVSSESYLTKRIPYLFFDIGIFLNITPEHLDKHFSFKNYLECKKELLKNSRIKIINRDCKYYNYLVKGLDNYLTFGKRKSDLWLIKYKLSYDNTLIWLKYKKKIYKICSPLIGKYNIESLMACMLCMLSLNYEMDDIISKISLIKNIPGRMEKINILNKHVMIDYAHTLMATKNVLSFLHKYSQKKIITVIGCAGGRYKEKRKYIGKYALKYSKLVYFTTDDPRDENPKNIVLEMINNSKKKNYVIELNRERAINMALDKATTNDLVIILGKGRDNYMAIGNKKIKYSDIETLTKYMKKM